MKSVQNVMSLNIRYKIYEIATSWRRQRHGKEKGFTKDCKILRITADYKIMHNGHGHLVLWEKSQA